MTAKEIATKIALLKGALQKEKNANAKKIIQKKIENLRGQAKTSNISTSQLAKKLLTTYERVKGMSDAELQKSINALKPRSEYEFLKGRIYVKQGSRVKYSTGKVRDDLKKYAKPVGWRIKGKKNTHKPTSIELAKAKKKGTAYYEDRPDRSDVVRIAKLEDGGMMATGGKTQSIDSKKVRMAIRGYMYSMFSSESNRMPESFFQTLTKAEEEKVDELVTPLILYVYNSFKGMKK